MYNLTDISTIKSILSKNGFHFSKALGQNFIINPDVCPLMAENCGADRESGVIEIGPGIGVLTAELAQRAQKVVCIELDKRLLPILSETLSDFDNVKIINDDVLKCDLKKIIEEEFAGLDVYVCANLPYYITSPVIMMLLESDLPIKAITVMVQKEAAQRICADVGSRDSGAVTVAVDYYSDANKLFDVKASSFMPAPKVDSSVIRMDIRKEKAIKVENEKLFFSIVKAAFGQRRKTAVNSLSSGLGIPKDKISEVLTSCGFDVNIRAEVMTMEDFALITSEIAKIEK